MKKKLKLLLLAACLPFLATSQTENIDVEGAIRIGQHTKVTPDSGTVEWNGTHFRGYDGTKWRILDMDGIVSMPGQSTIRAWQSFMQPIPNGVWTPLNFDMVNWDNAGELTPGPTAPPPLGGPEETYFTALESGYYQVNARVEFDIDSSLVLGDNGGTFSFDPSTYVTIAIAKSPGPPPAPGPSRGSGVTSTARIWAQGNNHQIAIDANGMGIIVLTPEGTDIAESPFSDGFGEPLLRNNAPNVADVVYLDVGETISIWVLYYNPITGTSSQFLLTQPFHKGGQEDPLPELSGPAALTPHMSKVYVSIHKQS